MKKTRVYFPMILAGVSLSIAALADEKTDTKPQTKPAAQTPAAVQPEKRSPAPMTAGSEKQKAVASTNSSASDTSPVICFIEKQDRTITIKAGPKGTIYSVKTAHGKILCENVSLDQLRAQAPELHDFIKSAIVLKSGKSDARLRMDASMR
jgi:hypothetical protein